MVVYFLKDVSVSDVSILCFCFGKMGSPGFHPPLVQISIFLMLNDISKARTFQTKAYHVRFKSLAPVPRHIQLDMVFYFPEMHYASNQMKKRNQTRVRKTFSG